MQEDGGSASGCPFLVEADIEAVLILVFVIDNMLTVIHHQIRYVPDIHHFVVMPIRITRPVDIVIHLDIGQCASGVSRNPKCFVEVINTDGRLSAALRPVRVKAHSVPAYKARCGENLFPDAVFILLVHGDIGCGFIHAHGRHNKQLICILCSGQVCHPLRRIRHMLDIHMQAFHLLRQSVTRIRNSFFRTSQIHANDHQKNHQQRHTLFHGPVFPNRHSDLILHSFFGVCIMCTVPHYIHVLTAGRQTLSSCVIQCFFQAETPWLRIYGDTAVVFTCLLAQQFNDRKIVDRRF